MLLYTGVLSRLASYDQNQDVMSREARTTSTNQCRVMKNRDHLKQGTVISNSQGLCRTTPSVLARFARSGSQSHPL